MNILLINPPGRVSFVSPPLGLLYVAAALKNNKHNVSVIDFGLEGEDLEKLSDRITNDKIDIVGISVVTPKVNGAITVADHVKKNFPHVTLIAGGPHATLLPEELLRSSESFDFVVQGVGEHLMNDLVDRIAKDQSVDGLAGIAYMKDGDVINTQPDGYIDDLDTIPIPARELIDINRYSGFLKTSASPATTVMTSRGCPYKCIYCSKPVTGSRVRSVTPENVIKELEHLKSEYGIKEVIFYDDSFTINKKRALKICDLMIEHGLDIKWQCETRVNLVDSELLLRMKEAGCYMIAYGIESGSDRVLGILKKGITVKKIEEAVSITKKAGIKIVGYFMLGIPGETKEEIEQTIKFAKSLSPDYAQFAVATAFPGTELYQMAKDADKLNDDWSHSIYALGGKPTVSLSDVPIDTLDHYVKKAYRSFYFRPSYIFNKLRNIRSVKDVIYNIRGLATLVKNS